MAHHSKGRSPTVEHDNRVFLHETSRESSDDVLLLCMQPHAQIESAITHRCCGLAHGATMRADHKTVRVKLVQVAADGVDRHVELLSHLSDGYLSTLGHEVNESAAAMRWQQARAVGGCVVVRHELFVAQPCRRSRHNVAKHCTVRRAEGAPCESEAS